MRSLLLLTLGMMTTLLILAAVGGESTVVEPKEISYVVTATTYTIDPKQTDNTPTITASGFNVGWKNPKKHKVIAISRDLKKALGFGKKVRLEGAGEYDGEYRVEDVMNKRFKNRIDILINPKDKHTKIDSVKLIAL